MMDSEMKARVVEEMRRTGYGESSDSELERLAGTFACASGGRLV